MKRAFFFDRDGVVNRDPEPEPYVLSWEQWVWQDGIRELLEAVRSRGFLTFLVTSQRGVGKGLMSEAELDAIHRRMQEELGALRFDAVYAFTGLPGCGNEAKPSPQMLHQAAAEWDLDLGASWLIGDADRDIAMARAAGLAGTIRVRGSKTIGEPADYTVEDLAGALAVLDGV